MFASCINTCSTHVLKDFCYWLDTNTCSESILPLDSIYLISLVRNTCLSVYKPQLCILVLSCVIKFFPPSYSLPSYFSPSLPQVIATQPCHFIVDQVLVLSRYPILIPCLNLFSSSLVPLIYIPSK